MVKRTVKAVMQVLEREHEDLESAAEAAVAAYEAEATKKEQHIVVARPLRDGPLVAVGPWTTRNQAERASQSFVSAHRDSSEGTGLAVLKMYHTNWINKLEGK